MMCCFFSEVLDVFGVKPIRLTGVLKTEKLRGFKILLVRLEDMTTQTNKVQTGEVTVHVKDRGVLKMGSSPLLK